jgi:D-xylonolactonase
MANDDVSIEIVADPACPLGEGPLWHPDEQALYWTDIEGRRLFRYDPATGDHQVVYQGDKTGGFTLQADGSLLLFQERGAVRVWRDGVIADTIHEEIADECDTRFNDVIADTVGRVFCGTMPLSHRLGRLYRLDSDGALDIIAEDIGCSNGMGFTPDGRYLYYTDSVVRKIYRYAYDPTTGALTDQVVFVTIPSGEGVPDGMTVDVEGNIWSARWDGGCLVCYAHEDGRELRRIPIPDVRKVSCVTFGGPDYTDMYLTTAGGDRKETEGKNAGALFRVRIPGIRGVPEFLSRVKPE